MKNVIRGVLWLADHAAAAQLAGVMDTSFFGTSLLALAAMAAAVGAGAGLLPNAGPRALAISGAAATAAFVAILGAFVLLMRAYAETDLSLINVYLNSHSLKPLVYKLTGTWGNHEGSLLLWLLILSGFGAVMALETGYARDKLRTAIGIQALLCLAFILFAAITSSPFAPYPETWGTPPDGRGLNPLLQDPGLAVHPPMLYLGYVGLSSVYSFTIAALIHGELGRDWARAVRPFLLFSWGALTLGIGLGAWWAYYELGWGGFWFWDPVENASLMPWLAATALLHCVMVVERREALKPWCAALAILAFGASLLGAFLVRSGIVTSVHAFANDPERGVVLLLLSILFTGGGFVLFALRGGKLFKPATFDAASREGAIVVNNLLFAVVLFTVFLGTFWPTVVEVLTGTRLSIGPPYYNVMVAPLALLMSATLALGLLIPWKRAGSGAWQRPLAIILGSGAGLALLLVVLIGGSLLATMGFAAAFIVLGAVVADLMRKAGLPGSDMRAVRQRLGGVSARSWAAVMSHTGLVLVILGITVSTVFQSEVRAVLEPGQSTQIRGMTLTYETRAQFAGRNYVTEIDRFSVSREGVPMGVMRPARRYYPAADQATTEVAIRQLGLGNLYLASASGPELGEARIVRAYVHPMIHALWGGAILIAAGGFTAAFAGRRATRPVRASVAQGSPAE